MSISYQGIGEWCATFACAALTEGKVVKMSGSGMVAACSEGDDFCGVCVAVGHDKSACSVQLGGLVTLGYTGSAPSVGFGAFSADGAGGVAVAATGGRTYLAVAVDTSAKTVTIKL